AACTESSLYLLTPRPRCLSFHLVHVFIYFFFFQAEDGIRDATVTGVQTCALPILDRSTSAGWTPPALRRATARASPPRSRSARRSEERRVGKECRSRWSQCLLRRKKK